MFKVKELPDGRMTILHSATGKLLGTLKNNPKLLKPKKEQEDETARVHPMPHSSSSSPSSGIKRKENVKIHSAQDDDCIDNITFFSSLGLVSNNFPISKKAKSPLKRKHKEQLLNDLEMVDFSSELFVHCSKIYKLSSDINNTNTPQPVVKKVVRKRKLFTCKKSKTFPRFEIANLPYCHTYAFTKKDKKENYKRLQTGLTKRSRHLLNSCKKLKVDIDRLSKEEVIKYTKKKPQTKKCSVQVKLLENQVKHVNGQYYIGDFKICEYDAHLIKGTRFSFQKNTTQQLDKPIKESIKEIEQNENRNHLVSHSPSKAEVISDDDDEVQIVQVINASKPPPQQSQILSNSREVNIVKPFKKVFGLPKTIPNILKKSVLNNLRNRNLGNQSDSIQVPKNDWKVLLPNLLDVKKWTFVCNRCTMTRLFTDRVLAAEHISQHIVSHSIDNPQKEVKQFCIKRGTYTEWLVQAFIKNEKS